MAEAILAMPADNTHQTVYYARGADGLLATAPETDITAVFSLVGWTVLAPSGKGSFRTTTVQEIAALDPDYIMLSDPPARSVLTSRTWSTLRAVREGHAVMAPSIPFGWIEEPPSINRRLGLACLKGSDPASLAALFNAAAYGHSLSGQQLRSVTDAAISFH